MIFIWYSYDIHFISKQILLFSSSFVIIYLIRFITTEIPYLGVSITLGSLDNTKKGQRPSDWQKCKQNLPDWWCPSTSWDILVWYLKYSLKSKLLIKFIKKKKEKKKPPFHCSVVSSHPWVQPAFIFNKHPISGRKSIFQRQMSISNKHRDISDLKWSDKRSENYSLNNLRWICPYIKNYQWFLSIKEGN